MAVEAFTSNSAFTGVISKKKITSLIEKASTLFAISIPLGFIFIAIYHYITQL